MRGNSHNLNDAVGKFIEALHNYQLAACEKSAALLRLTAHNAQLRDELKNVSRLTSGCARD